MYYKCGLKAGERLRLFRPLEITSHDGTLLRIRDPGEIWTVLPPCRTDPVIFLSEPGGDRHTWDDDYSIFEYFEQVNDDNK